MRAMVPLRALCQTLFVWHSAARHPARNYRYFSIKFPGSRTSLIRSKRLIPTSRPRPILSMLPSALFLSCSELCGMLGSVKIGAAISESISGFPVGATVAVTNQSVSSAGNSFAVPLLPPVRLPAQSFNFDQ